MNLAFVGVGVVVACGGGWGVPFWMFFFFLLSFIFFLFSFVVLHDRCMGAVLHVSVSLCAVAR